MTGTRGTDAEAVVSVRSVGKNYATYASNLHRFARWFGFPAKPSADYWAVRDVSFELRRGECAAIIGQNGAGKSTMLKIITGTVRPTTGLVHTSGRVNALLELGLGFNPELTGRQNIHLAGGLMGYSGEQIDKILPAIEEFAEIGEFVDQPLRIYSSGMQARLAFSLATAERPDLLIVDEVLAVGDSYFAHKSFDRIRRFREEGSSILVVTHSMTDVRTLCDRVILLEHGRVLKDGPPDEVVDFYNAMIAAKESSKLTIEQRRIEGGWLHSSSGTGEAGVERIGLVDDEGKPVQLAMVGQALHFEAVVSCRTPVSRLVLGLMIRDKLGHVIWGSNTWHAARAVNDLLAGDRVKVRFSFINRLGPGSYALTVALHNDESHLSANYEWQDNLFVFDVINADRTTFIGCNWLDGEFAVSKESDGESRQDKGANSNESVVIPGDALGRPW